MKENMLKTYSEMKRLMKIFPFGITAPKESDYRHGPENQPSNKQHIALRERLQFVNYWTRSGARLYNRCDYMYAHFCQSSTDTHKSCLENKNKTKKTKTCSNLKLKGNYRCW